MSSTIRIILALGFNNDLIHLVMSTDNTHLSVGYGGLRISADNWTGR